MSGDEAQRLAELERDGTVSNVAGLVYELTGWGEDVCLRAAERLLAVLSDE